VLRRISFEIGSGESTLIQNAPAVNHCANCGDVGVAAKRSLAHPTQPHLAEVEHRHGVEGTLEPFLQRSDADMDLAGQRWCRLGSIGVGLEEFDCFADCTWWSDASAGRPALQRRLARKHVAAEA
jgi:hypothetical protein